MTLDLDDLSEFFTDELAIPVTCPSGAEVCGIFTDASADSDEHGQAMVDMMDSDVRRESLDIGVSISLVRPLTGERTTYKIEGRRSDGVGLSTVLLRKT